MMFESEDLMNMWQLFKNSKGMKFVLLRKACSLIHNLQSAKQTNSYLHMITARQIWDFNSESLISPVTHH